MIATRSILAGIALMAMSVGASAQQQTLFDFGWQFTQDGKTISIDLPHDWDIFHAPSKDAPMGNDGGYYHGGKGEYRKTFKTPDGELVNLHFEGVYQHVEVFVNGQKAGQHAYGYTPFTVDITPYLYKDKMQDNEVVVKVDNSQQPNCRWYSGSGIYRHVWLQTMPAVHIMENGVSIQTPEVSAEKARVDLNIWVENAGKEIRQIDDIEVTFKGGTFAPQDEHPKRLYLPSVSISNHPSRLPKGLTMTPPYDEPEEKKTENVPLNPGRIATYVQSFTIEKPRLWSPDAPFLYEATVRMKCDGRIVCEQRVKFGIRSFSFDAGKGFVLNGKKLLINGACVHHDDGVLGAMAFDAAEARKVRLMKEAGFNLIRTSHNPATRALLDACDSLGMLVIDEAFDGWRTQKTAHDYHELFDSCYRADVQSMVMRDRNHPSVICWSIGNEVIERKDLRVVTTARQLKNAVLEMDDTRPVTEALCSWDSDWEIFDPHAEVLDVVGYNYMMHKHESDHQRDPQRVMWQTESYPRDAFLNWQRTSANSYIVGDIVWTGLDYLGESGIGRYYYEGESAGEHYQRPHFPWHGAYCGDVDITGWRKPISHYRDMLWNDVRQPYLAVKEPNGYYGQIKETQWSVWPTWESWNWPGWEGKPVEVEVYTKDPVVALYLDDNLIGKREVNAATGYKAVFKLDYQPGVLKAVTESGSTVLATADKPYRIRLTPDRRVVSADGQDLAFITVEVVDKKGRVVPDAAIPCEVSVGGCGQLMAAASADLKDLEPTTSPKMTTWKGRSLIVVRSSRKAGSIHVAVKSQLPAAGITLKAK